MTMPLIPGLQEGADTENSVAGEPGEETPKEKLRMLLDTADPDALMDLAAEATVAMEDGELEDAVEGDDLEESMEESVEEVEGDPEEEEVAGLVLPETTATEVSIIVEDIAAMETELSDVAAASDESESDGVDVQKAVDAVAEAMSEAEEAKVDAETAVNDQDMDAAGAAKEKATAAKEKATAALEEVKEVAKTEADKLDDPSEPDPLKLWAERNS